MVDARPEDETFLFELYCTTRAEELAAWNWPPAEQESFLRMQHRCQCESYAQQHPNAVNKIVLRQGNRTGRILTARLPDAIALIDIAVLPACRNQGLGTLLVRQVQEAARAEGCGVRLHVLAYSPARRLYIRLGFRDDGGSLPYLRMRWDPEPPIPASGGTSIADTNPTS
jgi:ribosomal protein S18 acetylase RimI-like enzyme